MISTELTSYTHRFIYGVPRLIGEGDLHDRKYSSYRRSILLTPEGLFSSFSASYTLTLYPRRELFALYETNNPLIGTVGAVGLIFFTSILFLLYDYLVRRQSRHQVKMLETKRRFVRFISHEIRTPLNTVSLALQFLLDDMLSVQSTGERDACKQKEEAVVEVNEWTDEEAGRRVITSDQLTALTTIPLQMKKIADWLELLRDVYDNAQNAVSVLNDILNYDKIDMGKMQLEKEEVDLWNLLNKTVKEFEIGARQKRVELLMVLQPWQMETCDEQRADLLRLRVHGDIIRLTQVVRNLVSNALKFTPVDGNTLQNLLIIEVFITDFWLWFL